MHVEAQLIHKIVFNLVVGNLYVSNFGSPVSRLLRLHPINTCNA